MKKEHNECWYRVNLYSDASDLLFLTNNLFESKRQGFLITQIMQLLIFSFSAECESMIAKTLKKLKQ